MLDLKRVRQELQTVCDTLRERGMSLSPEHLLTMDEERRALLQTAEEKKAARNGMYAQLAAAKKQGRTADMDGLTALNVEIKALDEHIATLEAQIREALSALPNLPLGDVPAQSTELTSAGEVRHFDWEPKTYREIGQDLGIAVFSPAKGRTAEAARCHVAGRRLKRAMLSLLPDGLAEAGYTETEQLCAVKGTESSLLTSFRGRIFSDGELPLAVCAHAVCPAEDGFFADRVELCRIMRPDENDDALAQMTAALCRLLDALALPYRTVLRGRGELELAAAKTVDIEVWLPCEQRYVPAASCSDCTDFTARDLELRIRTQPKEKPRTARTLYGVIDITRLLAAILGNHQQGDGSVTVPEALVPYLRQSVIR